MLTVPKRGTVTGHRNRSTRTDGGRCSDPHLMKTIVIRGIEFITTDIGGEPQR